jgi:type IV pilus assembly protein PilV
MAAMQNGKTDMNHPRLVAGTTLLEVLVTIVILAIGILGLAALQMRLHGAEMESYQRTQALMLLEDMAVRLTANRSAANDYDGASVTPGTDCADDFDDTTRYAYDMQSWCNAIQGAAETTETAGSLVKKGTLIGGRGCIEKLDTTGFDVYLITIAWQGLGRLSAPPSSVTCGTGQYNDGLMCTNDLCRRAVTTLVRFSSL